MRGRNRPKGPNPLTRSYESNGPDVKLRGTAQHIADKYAQLARDALAAGDPVAAENYFQHGEHYFRIVSGSQDHQRPQQTLGYARQGYDDEMEGDEEENGAPNGQANGHGYAAYGSDEYAEGGQPSYENRQDYNRQDQGRGDYNRQGQDRQDRQDNRYNDGPRGDRRERFQNRQDRQDRNGQRFEGNRNDYQRQDRGDQPRADYGQRNDRPRHDLSRNEAPRQEFTRQDPGHQEQPRAEVASAPQAAAATENERPARQPRCERRRDREEPARAATAEETGGLPAFLMTARRPAAESAPETAPAAVSYGSEPPAPAAVSEDEAPAPKPRRRRRPRFEGIEGAEAPATAESGGSGE